MADSATQVAETKTIQPKANSANSSSTAKPAPGIEDNSPQKQKNQELQDMMANSAGTSPSPNGKDLLAPSMQSGNILNEEFDISEIPEDYNPDKFNLDAEKKIDPNSKDHKEKLATHEKSKAEMGKSAQIKLAGELTYAARFNRFIGKESTYSILQRKAEEFNKETDVVKKQLLLKELKPLAQTWLEKHDNAQSSGDKEDANEKLKRESIYKFLEQTTSNYSDIKSAIENFNSEWKNCLAVTDTLLEDFTSFRNRYQELKTDFNTYKNKYPPSINLLYNDEVSSLNLLLSEANSGSHNGLDVAYEKFGFKLLNTKIGYSFSSKDINFEGNVSFTVPDAISPSGKIKVVIKEGKPEITIVENIEGKFKSGNITISCKDFEYNDTDGLVSSKVSANLNLYGTDYLIESSYANLTEKGLNHEVLTGTAEFIDLKDHKTHVIAAQLVFKDGTGLSLDGMLELTERSISIEQGLVNATFDENLVLKQLSFKRAKGRMNFMGEEFILGGLGYELSSKSVTVEYVEKRFKIASYNLIVSSKKGSVGLDNELDARIFKGKLKGEIDTEKGIAVTDPAITHDRGGSEAESKTRFEGGFAVKVGDNFNANGKVDTTFTTNGFETIKIKEGTVKGTYEGIELEMTGLSYNDDIISAKSVNGSIQAFDKTINLLFTNARIEGGKFDFESISASLDEVDFGLLKVTSPTLLFKKADSSFTATLDYELDKDKLPQELKGSEFKAEGGLEVKWDPNNEENRYYKINETNASLSLLKQTLVLKSANYSSKDKKFHTETADLKLNLSLLKDKTFGGKGISIKEGKFDFEEISLKQEDKFDLGIASLTSNKYLLKKKDGALKIQADGTAKLNLPKAFEKNSTAEFEGNIGITLDNPVKQDFNITKGKAEFEVGNPLVELSKFLGSDWSTAAAKFEVGASIPVFPGIFAMFGLFIELMAKMPEKIAGSATVDKETLNLALKLDEGFKLNIRGGVYGGVQAGTTWALALAVILEAAAKMGVDLSLVYNKGFKLGEGEKKPDEEVKPDQDGLTYSLKGSLNVGAYLKVVATALYFFSKEFTLTLGEKNLGDFEFSNATKTKPEMNKTDHLADKKQLEDNIDADKKEEYKKSNLNIIDLLSMDFTKRFEKEDKSNVVESFVNAEDERKDQYVKIRKKEAENKKGTFTFYDKPIIDLQDFDDFMNKRCSWEGIHQVINELGEKLKSKAEIVDPDSNTLKAEGKGYLDNKILPNLEHLGKSSNMADAFVSHYEKKIDYFKEKYVTKREYQAEGLKEYIELLNKKLIIFRETNSMKRYIHSQRKGDEKQQKEQVVTSGWFLGKGESNYEAFSKAYSDFVQVMKNQNKTFEAAELRGKSVKENLIAAHKAGRFKK